MKQATSGWLKSLSWVSANCPVCRQARRKQEGLAFSIVKTCEEACPFCRAYFRVTGRKSHERVPENK